MISSSDSHGEFMRPAIVNFDLPQLRHKDLRRIDRRARRFDDLGLILPEELVAMIDETDDDVPKNGKPRDASDESETGIERPAASTEAPSIGSWYETDEGEVFQVYATDEDTDAMEVRFLDGTVDTWVLSDWPGFEEVEAPDAWGTMDNYPAGRRKRGD